MKNKLFKKLLGLGAGVFTFFALATSASACTCSFYQPKEPKALREE
ncbi:hypothetical protein CLOACE_15380 [Clostridium acetireducens DSM 10703]|uniref:Cyclic lactone autoinducer peptide n=1 Tax=Clostridium acetireducens DSM 10703 TaxID=1121290 RepID=A0A1E8EY36_9CLOT|nr:cyclic lactone autoinducer peptide [Clostridium acetireducens]OFI05843.1 hypothetical protein CLOACE_15380 [Clostridium acetireducens DSM 10703]